MKSSGMTLAIIGLVVGVIGGYLIPRSTPGTDQNETASVEHASEMATEEPTSAAAPTTPDAKIANAISAAPAAIAKNATVLDWPAKEGDPLPTLRKGSNEWTCLPDFPTTPGNDPICADKTAMQWFNAYMSHKEPRLSQAGLAYMLQGGSDASNVDPYAEAPKPGEDWMNAPAHIMIFPAGKLDAKVYGTDMESGGPWVMWANTPYAHIMMPVK